MTKEELKDQFSVECTEIDKDGSLKVKGSPMDIINWIAEKFCLSDVSEKRMFQILDEMNLDDVKNNTRLVSISNTLISADKIKQGSKISIGADEQALYDLITEKVIPVLILVDKTEYFKRKK